MNKNGLNLPVNCLEIGEKEKEYIDGGFAVSRSVVASGINAAISVAVGGGVGIAGVKAFIMRKGKEEAKRIFTRTVKSKLIALGCGSMAASAEWAINFAINAMDIGGAAADWLDAHDTYHNNGWIG